MKSISLALVLAAACGQAHTHTFVRTDAKFEPQQKAAEAAFVWDDDELGSVEPFRSVGILQFRVSYSAKVRVDDFLAEAARVGAQSGCDVLLERDVFDLGHRLTRLNETGPIWIWEDAKYS